MSFINKEFSSDNMAIVKGKQGKRYKDASYADTLNIRIDKAVESSVNYYVPRDKFNFQNVTIRKDDYSPDKPALNITLEEAEGVLRIEKDLFSEWRLVAEVPHYRCVKSKGKHGRIGYGWVTGDKIDIDSFSDNYVQLSGSLSNIPYMNGDDPLYAKHKDLLELAKGDEFLTEILNFPAVKDMIEDHRRYRKQITGINVVIEDGGTNSRHIDEYFYKGNRHEYKNHRSSRAWFIHMQKGWSFHLGHDLPPDAISATYDDKQGWLIKDPEQMIDYIVKVGLSNNHSKLSIIVVARTELLPQVANVVLGDAMTNYDISLTDDIIENILNTPSEQILDKLVEYLNPQQILDSCSTKYINVMFNGNVGATIERDSMEPTEDDLMEVAFHIAFGIFAVDMEESSNKQLMQAFRGKMLELIGDDII